MTGKLIPDNPDADCTDYAHPAFWRGYDYSVAEFIHWAEQILDGKDNGMGITGNARLEKIRRRMLKLVENERMKQ